MKVIFDANIWISFVLGKRLALLENILQREGVDVFVSKPLIDEINVVLSRPKFKDCITDEKLNNLQALFFVCCKMIDITQSSPYPIRDAKDLNILSMADSCNADYIVTGDEDLLVIGNYNKTRIEKFSVFIEQIFKE